MRTAHFTWQTSGCRVLVCTVSCLALAGSAVRTVAENLQSSGAKPVDFAREIRPILAEHCLSCHSGEEPEGGLRLGEQGSAFGPGESGRPVIVPGKPAESELIRRVTAADADSRMPPEGEKPLSAESIEKLSRWIAEGAPWTTHWALQPLSPKQPPEVREPGWVRNDVDRFVLARLEQVGVAPSPEADRNTLIRRLHFDLLGLPPSLAEVDAFCEDDRPDAYDRLVDRLLRSPHFGERWGRHWLDLAHYADSDGYEKDRARPDAYLYRDWVIEAINGDMPFDEFTIQQLAGDLHPGAGCKERIATAMLRQTLTNEEGGVDQEEFRVAACFDRTETVGTVWLALTIGCARCHEHKYDPLAHADYYRLFAFFNNAEEVWSEVPVEAENLPELERKLRPLTEALAARRAELAQQALAWETAEHKRIMAQPEGPLREHAPRIVSVESAAEPPTPFTIEQNEVFVMMSAPMPAALSPATVSAAPPDKDTYTVTLIPGESIDVTGFKLEVLPDDRLPNRGPGLAPNGNFVLTGFQVSVPAGDGKEAAIEVHRPSTDFSQSGFSPDQVLRNDPSGRTGWAIADKQGEAHHIQLRTREPLRLAQGAPLRIQIAQQHGGQHLLGRFRLLLLSGDQRGLHLSDRAIADALEMYPEKRVARTKQQVFDYYLTQVARDEPARLLQQQIGELHQEHKARLMEVRAIGTPWLPRATHVFHRGDFLAPKEPIEPGVPAILAPFQSRGPQADRLDLARWLVSDENFLTPRVAVNHIWQYLFGQGLVRTPNDFGSRGQPPTHPELLDWLALRVQRDLNWSRKELIRLIVGSATYRQSAHVRPDVEAKDPLNTLLFRQNRFRVESEIVRDMNLAVAGLLSAKIGGPSVFPPMPEDLAKLSYADSFSWQNSVGEDRYRRGMYTFFKRTVPHPNLTTFDSPDANVACVRRTLSNTPLQALTLLNNEVHVEASQALARRVLVEGPALPAHAGRKDADSARFRFALRLCLARPPSAQELVELQGILDSARDYYSQHADDAARLVGQYAPQGVPVDEAAAWVAAVRVVLNLDEFFVRG